MEIDVNKGLNEQEVEERILDGKSNIVHDKNEKTTFQIIMGNTFTFFNINFHICTPIILFFS